MKTDRRITGGFTLIELLIVVAIIAILAAIAIPNFLEAQTRAKVGRAKSDMRTISLAMESYRIDNNVYCWRPNNTTESWRYPYPNTLFGGASDYVLTVAGAHGLTSPLAYMTSIPQDPFQSGGTPVDAWGQSLYASVDQGNNTLSYVMDRQVRNMIDNSIKLPGANANVMYGIWSIGPDRRWLDTEDPPWNYTCYDPSNGTVSLGNIWRFGP